MEKVLNNKWLKVGLFSLLGLLLAAGLILAGYKLEQRQIKPVPTSTLAPRPEVSSPLDETADWKTYTNTKYGYSAKYPPSLVYAVSPKGEGQVVFGASLEGATQPAGLESKAIVITVQAGVKSPLIDRRTQFGAPATIKEEKSLNIGGYKGEQVHFDSPTNFLQSAVSYKDKVFYFNLHNLKFLEEFNLMLSTFRFLE